MENKIDPKLMTPEVMAKAMACETADELVALAKESGVTLTPEEAQKYLAEMEDFHVDLSEEDMAKVAGGDGCWNHLERCDKHEYGL